jgi:ribose transport system substrate-binding protein
VKNPNDSLTLNRSIDRACDVLFAFRDERELLRLRDVAARTGLNDASALRIVRTLVARGMLERADSQHYRSRVRMLTERCHTIGYAAQTTEFAFSREVTASVIWAAERQGINLVSVDNRYSRAAAIRNAESLIKRGVNLAIEFQTDEKAAPIISSLYKQAGIPVIAIEIPHPGATFFGADNYKAGLIGGRHLGHEAQEHWAGEADEILILELPKAGPLPASRMTGILDGIRETAPHLSQARIVRLNGNGQFSRSLEVVRKYLRQTHARRILVGAINDPSALGALRAFEEAGRGDICLVIGQNASLEARAEMRRPGTRLMGSVAYFPERYGPQLIQLALTILQQRQAPPAIFVNHQLVTPQNVNSIYPNDPLLSAASLDSLMLQAGVAHQ